MSYIDGKVRKGARVIPSQRIEERYQRRLESLCRAMFSAEDAGVRRGNIRSVFSREAPSVAADFTEESVKFSAASASRSVKRLSNRGTDYHGETPDLERAAHALAKENADLIRSIPEVYFGKVDEARRTLKGSELDDRLAQLRTITLNRAKLIAHDQTNKAAEGLALNRFRDNGIMYVMWRHSHLSAVPRDYHLTKWDGHSGIRNGRPNGLNGFVFRIEEPPVIDLKTGERGYPSQLINCKCFLVPVQIKNQNTT